MTDYVIIGGAVIPVETAVSMSSTGVGTNIYMDFTVVDPVEGSLRFLIGQSGFSVGSDRVYAAVTTWGALRKFMALDGSNRDNTVEIEMASDAVVVAANGTKQFTVHQIVRDMPIFDAKVDFVQSDDVSSGNVIWSGYFGGIQEFRWGNGISTVTMLVEERRKGMLTPMSDIINRTDFPNAPDRTLGLMVPRAYGNWKAELDSGSTTKFPPPCFGIGTKMVEAIVTDEAVASSAGPFSHTIFSKLDGTSLPEEAFSSNSNEPGGDLWCYLESPGVFASLDGGNISVFVNNDNASLRCDIPNSPIVFAVMRLSDRGTETVAGFSSVLHKPIDDDPTNYVVMNATDHTLAYNVPSLNVPGAKILDVRVMLDASDDTPNALNVDYGIWNVQDTGGANWWGGSKKMSQGFVTRRQVVTSAANSYLAGDCRVNNGQATDVEYTNGKFIARDGSQNEVPLQVKITRTSGTGGRIYNVAVIVKIQLPQIKTGTRPGFYTDRNGHIILPPFHGLGNVVYHPPLDILGSKTTSAGTRFMSMAKYQKDDGSGTYTGTANKRINRAPEIAQHLIAKIGGFACNTTTGTVGNFVDARIEDVAGEKEIDIAFGQPEKEDLGQAIDKIQTQWPGRIFQENGTWQFVNDEMNPHSSRMYRSTSDIVRISAQEDLIPSKAFHVSETPFKNIRNRVTVNYNHSFLEEKPSGSVRYNNPISQDYFGVSDEVIIDAPVATKRDYSSGDSPAAIYLANYHGRVNARPRLSVVCALSQKFFDLRRGHIVEFEKDMEAVGLQCPAYRCGRFDYIFNADTSSTNQANAVAPALIPGSGTSRISLGLSQQTDRFTATISDTAAYTTVNNGWWYWNGSSRVTLTNVTTSDGVDPDDFFKTLGTRTLFFDRPTPTSWKKAELTFNSVLKGPSYFFGMDYTTATNSGAGSALCTYPATWWGRMFEVVEVTRKPGTLGDYPYVETVLQEVM